MCGRILIRVLGTLRELCRENIGYRPARNVIYLGKSTPRYGAKMTVQTPLGWLVVIGDNEGSHQRPHLGINRQLDGFTRGIRTVPQ
jgi:hypothetical protein